MLQGNGRTTLGKIMNNHEVAIIRKLYKDWLHNTSFNSTSTTFTERQLAFSYYLLAEAGILNSDTFSGKGKRATS